MESHESRVPDGAYTEMMCIDVMKYEKNVVGAIPFLLVLPEISRHTIVQVR